VSGCHHWDTFSQRGHVRRRLFDEYPSHLRGNVNEIQPNFIHQQIGES